MQGINIIIHEPNKGFNRDFLIVPVSEKWLENHHMLWW